MAAVARRVRDLGVAEELAQDALVAALERWPQDGVPNKPGAWLMTTAINRALDWLRHRQMADARHDDMASDLEAMEAHVVPDFTDGLDMARAHAAIGDDLLRLIITACHPVLVRDARVPFEVPRGEQLTERLGSVLEVVYLMFNEGYTASSGDNWDHLLIRRGLAALDRAAALADNEKERALLTQRSQA